MSLNNLLARVSLISTFALILALIFGVAHAAEPQPSVIRIGLPAALGADGAPLHSNTLGPYVDKAIEEEFAGTGTKIEYRYFVNAGPGINEAFASKQIDFGAYGDFPSIIARSGGIDIKLVVPAGRVSQDVYLAVPNGSTAKSIIDLKGKRIAVNAGRPWALTFSRLLEANGLKSSDFQIFNLVMEDGDAAVASGKIDAQVTIDGLKLQSRGLAKIIWSSKDAPISWGFSYGFFGRSEFLAAHPEETARLVRGYIRGLRYYGDPAHRDEYLKNMSVTRIVPLEAVTKAYEGRDLRKILVPLFDPFLAAHYREAVAFALQNKLIRRGFEPSELFEPRFNDAALKSLGLETYWTPLQASGDPVGGKSASLP